MDGCPNEILSLIFEEACTDDGLTGRSLSLVSSRVRDTSRRYAFRSIALYGSHQLSAFAPLLDKADLEDRAIRHLYLTDRRRVWMEYLPGQDREQWLEEHIAEDFRVNDPSRRSRCSSSAILRIFAAAAPTLETLTLLLFNEYDEPPFSDAASFPELCELTIHASNLAHTVQSELPQCLSLRRLHVIHDVSLKRPMTATISRIAPHLTHLRISRLNPNLMGSGDVVRGLEHMLQQDDPQSTGFPPTLKRVLVRMRHQNVHQRRPGGVLHMLTSLMAYQLKNVAMRDVRGRIAVLKPETCNASDSALPVADLDVQFYMGTKAAWQEHVVGSESSVWHVETPSILASHGYHCAETEW